MKLIFLGPPGSGKGTYATKIAKEINVPHISTGNMLRQAMAEETELGKRAKENYDAGKPVSNELMRDIIIEVLSKAENGFIFDCPYNIEQAKSTQENAKTAADIVININVPEEVIIKRMSGRRMCKKCNAIYNLVTMKGTKEEGKCDECEGELFQRKDDTEEAVQVRLDEYKKRAGPMLEYYRDKGILVDIAWNKTDIPEGDVDVPVEIMVNKILDKLKNIKSK